MTRLLAPRLTVAFGGVRVPSFHACGYAGLVAGLGVGVWTCARYGLSIPLFLVVVACATATFLGLALAVKVASGEERLVYYHHEVAIFAVTALVLAGIGAPVLRYLDLCALFVGAFLACGRAGCNLVGCCHGRPWRRGVAYGRDHVEAGFPAGLAGIRLVPVQLVEAAAVTAIVLSGAVMFDPAAPGRALVWYVTAYGCLRFVLETLRGDGDVRPSYLGVSEAQWISVVSAAAVAGLGHAGVVPEVAGGTGAALVLAAAASLRATFVVLHRAPAPGRTVSP